VPANIGWQINVSDQWPGCYLINGGLYNRSIVVSNICNISRIGRFIGIGIVGLNDVIIPVKGYIPHKLDLYRTVVEALNGKNRNILGFVRVQINP